MAAISAEIKELLIQTELFVFPEDFVVVYLPQNIKAISGEWFRTATTRFAMCDWKRLPSLDAVLVRRTRS